MPVLRRGVLDYDRRHGYRGAEAYVDHGSGFSRTRTRSSRKRCRTSTTADDLLPALVLDAGPRQVSAYLRGGEILKISGDGLKFAARMLDDKAPRQQAPAARRHRSACRRTTRANWQIVQLPEVEAAFVAASPIDGAIRALVGGFDFNRNKFNHVTQAWRQPGSSFKPFIYSAALEKGYTPASVIDDEPISISAEETGSQSLGAEELRRQVRRADDACARRWPNRRTWCRSACCESIGPQYAQDYVTRFGFDADKHPPYLTMALGAGAVTPWQQLTGLCRIRQRRLPDCSPIIVKRDSRRQGQRPRRKRSPRWPATKTCASSTRATPG